MTIGYVHGYEGTEAQRLRDQAQSLTDLLHGDTRYPAGAAVLEAGCGVGAQTVTLLRNSPEARFTAIDLSPGSLEQARCAAEAVETGAVEFLVADIFALPYPEAAFDHAFVCFVLEHLANPVKLADASAEVAMAGSHGRVLVVDFGRLTMSGERPQDGVETPVFERLLLRLHPGVAFDRVGRDCC